MSDAIHRAHQARHELALTEEAFGTVRQILLEELASVTPTDTGRMQALVCGIQSLAGVRKALRAIVDTGDMEEAAQALRPLMSAA